MATSNQLLCLRWSCCGANSKETCTWPPCPANLDIYTPEELKSFAEYDAPRLDRALGIFVSQEDT